MLFCSLEMFWTSQLFVHLCSFPVLSNNQSPAVEVVNVPKRRKRRERGQEVKISKFQVSDVGTLLLYLKLVLLILITYQHFAGSQDLRAESATDYFAVNNRCCWSVPVVERHILAF
jgi:hypothetical protein